MGIALITGASSGIGYETAKIFAQNGHDVILVARNEQKLQQISQELISIFSIKTYILSKDLSDIKSCNEIYEWIKENKIQIDFLVNNAGFGDFGEFYSSDINKMINMLNLNIVSLTYLTRLFMEDMIKARKGKIMNLSSVAGFFPGPLMSVYYASKSYVLNFSLALSKETEGTGITVTALCPGPTKSDFDKNANLEESKIFKDPNMPTSYEVALYGYESMMNGKLIAVHGMSNKIVSIFIRLLPYKVQLYLINKTQERK